jgi:hypothetical protein
MCGKKVAYNVFMNSCGLIEPRESRVEPCSVNQELLRTIEGEFAEMPGMRLTEAQFRRLWALNPTECQRVTTVLVNNGVLARDAGGRYCRHEDLRD